MFFRSKQTGRGIFKSTFCNENFGKQINFVESFHLPNFFCTLSRWTQNDEKRLRESERKHTPKSNVLRRLIWLLEQRVTRIKEHKRRPFHSVEIQQHSLRQAEKLQPLNAYLILIQILVSIHCRFACSLC